MKNRWMDIQSKVNANKTFNEKVMFMTLGQIKQLHDDNGIDSKGMKLDQSTFVSTLKLLGEWK